MKWIVMLLLMPVGLWLLATAACLWLATRLHVRRGTLIGLLSVTLAFGYLASTPIVGRALTLGLMHLAQNTPDADLSRAQAIVVLTGGSYWAGEAAGWMPRPESMHRLAVAYELQRQLGGRIPVIVSGGHTNGFTNPSEARVVADFFARFRPEILPTELEETSTDTYESAMQLAPVLLKRNPDAPVILVTGESHLARSMAVYRARGVNVIGVPAQGLWGPFGKYGWVPSVIGLQMTTLAFYDGLGLVSYWLGGKINANDFVFND